MTETISGTTIMGYFVSGTIVMGYMVAGLFFFRFWKETRDRLFGIFGAAFWMLAFQRLVLTFTGEAIGHTLIYGMRLAAFLLILYAIWDKNRRPD